MAQKTDTSVAVGKALREAREALGYTRPYVAKCLDTTPTTVYRYERSERIPDVNALMALATVYDKAPGDFFPTGNDMERAKTLLRGETHGENESENENDEA